MVTDKYFVSPFDGATIAREIYISVDGDCQNISRFGLVLPACGSWRVCGFWKKGKRAISLDSGFWKGNQRASGSYATIKIGLTSFIVVACPFLMNHVQVLQKWLPLRIT